MNYTDILKRAWHTTWHNWGIWAFYLVMLLLYGVVLAVAIAVALSLVAPAFGVIPFGSDAPAGIEEFFGVFGAILVAIAATAVLTLPITLIMRGGLVGLTWEAQEGRTASFGEGWRYGVRSMGRVFLFELLIGLVVAVLFGLVFGAMAALIAATDGGGDSSGAAVIAGICLLYLFIFVLSIAFALFGVGFEAVGVRYAVIDRVSATQAFASAAAMLKTRLKNVVLMGLIMLGIQMAVGFVSSMVTTPLQFFAMPIDPTSADPTELFLSSRYWYSIGLVYVISFLVQIPFAIFSNSAWTAFFRALTGRDTVLAEEPAPAYPGAYLPPPPSAPAPPAPPAYPPAAPPAPPVVPPAYPAPPQAPAPPAPPAPSAEPPAPPAAPEEPSES